jgi:hypothetical protein
MIESRRDAVWPAQLRLDAGAAGVIFSGQEVLPVAKSIKRL